jgi:hypothetical protein
VNKIPVWKTVSFAYSFTFGHLATIIGLIWIPMLAITVGTFFVMKPYYETIAAAGAGGLAGAGSMLFYVFAIQIAGLLIFAIVAVAITREALGLRKPGHVFAHFALGPAEFRVFGAFLILIGLWLGFVLAYLLAVGVVSGIIAFAMRATGGNALTATAIGGLVALVGFCAVIYAMVRLSYLVVPVTVAEGYVGVIRGWTLTQGNFWRIFAISLLAVLPIFCVIMGIEVAILGPDAFIPPLDALKDPAKEAEFAARQARTMLEHMPVVMGLSFLVSPILNGLIFAPGAIAYRALVPPGSQPVASD